MSDLEVRLESVRARIAAAARRARRTPAEIELVAVTKGQPASVIRAAYELGLRAFGENRVEEAEEKAPGLPADIAWHMIGHIQSRKSKRVPPLFCAVHSLDSLDLALRLDRLCVGRSDPLPVLLECNVSGEESKCGFDAAAWHEHTGLLPVLADQLERIVALPHLRVEGLMTMAPVVSDPEQARPVFASLRLLRDALQRAVPGIRWQHLSMGMTDDFEVAIEEGATLVRIGRAIFAPEQPASCPVQGRARPASTS